MAIVFIGIGSNLGDSFKNITDALKLMQETKKIKITKVSRFHKTKPVGGPPQPDFLNAAAKIETSLSPQELLKTLNQIENQLGRVRTIKNGPRTIDLDILLFDDLKINEPNLKIPHPRMFERDFVMQPLGEIAPEICRP